MAGTEKKPLIYKAYCTYFALKARGFTIVEVILSIAFLAVTLLATSSMIINVSRNGSTARKTSLACHLCQAKIESLKSLGYNGLANSQENNLDESGNSGGIFNRTVIVASGPVTDTKFVTVTVSWADVVKSHAVSLRTLIANQ